MGVQDYAKNSVTVVINVIPRPIETNIVLEESEEETS